MMSAPRGSILVVDDEAPFRRALRGFLTDHGLAVAEVPNAGEALRAIRESPYDLALLDIDLPEVNGLELCRQFRALGHQAGILMVIAGDAESDFVQASEAGADDCISKPFRASELVGRCRAVLRKISGGDAAGQTTFRAGELALDLNRRQLLKGGKRVHLTPKEFNLLALLMRNQGKPLTHAKLLRTIWGPEYGAELEYLRSYVRLLRKKVEDDPARPKYLVTEPSLGYRFCSSPPSALPDRDAKQSRSGDA